MRVSSNNFSYDLKLQMRKLAEHQLRLQQQITTGQRVTTASDDPKAMRRVLDLRTERSMLTQYQDNINTLRENANVVYSTTNSLKRLSDRASELAALADGTKGQTAISAYAKEVDQLLEEAVRLSNTQHRDVYIFSGTNAKTAAYNPTRDADGQITGVTFTGNANSIQVDIAPSAAVNANYSAEGPGGSQHAGGLPTSNELSGQLDGGLIRECRCPARVRDRLGGRDGDAGQGLLAVRGDDASHRQISRHDKADSTASCSASCIAAERRL